MAKRIETTSTKSGWTPEMKAWLVDHAGDSRSVLVPAFQAKFPAFAKTISSTAILGQRFHQLNRQGPKGLDAKITALELKLEHLRAHRVTAEKAASAKLVAKAQAKPAAKSAKAPRTWMVGVQLKPEKAPAKKTNGPAGKSAPKRTVKASPVKVTKAAAAKK